MQFPSSRKIAPLLVLVVIAACSRFDGEIERSSVAPPTDDQPVETSDVPAGGTAGAPGVGDVYYPELGNGGYDVTAYDIDIEWRPDDGEIAAVADLQVTPTSTLTRFNLDLAGLTVESVTVDGADADFSREERELVITPPEPLADGESVPVVVTYHGAPEPETLGSRIFAGGWYIDGRDVYVASEPAGAATWFPGNDHPTDKATFRFRITVPDDLVAVANGVRVGSPEGEPIDGGRRVYTYEADDPMATYLASVVIGDLVFDEREAPNGVPLRDAFPTRLADEARKDFAATGDMMVAFESWFGPYPFEIYGHAVADEDLGFALENQTLTLFGSDLISPPGRVDEIVAHELAHQWFGNAVSPAQWRDIWLNEGFATFAEWVWEFEARGTPIADSAAATHGFSDRLGMPADPGREELFIGSVYQRGALVLFAVMAEIGEDGMKALFQEWMDRHGGGAATTEDFITLAEELAGRDLTALFDAWLYGDELPPFPR